MPIPEVGGAAEFLGSGATLQRSTEISMETDNFIDVESVRGDDDLVMRVPAASLQPFDVFIACHIGILAVHALAGPICRPVRRVLQELSCSKGVGKHDPQRSIVRALPQIEYMVLRSFQGLVIVRQRGQHHGDFMCIRAYRLEVVLMREKGVRRSYKPAAEIGSHRLDDVLLPQKAVPAPGSEIRHAQTGHATQALNFAPELRLRPGIQNVEIELAQLLQTSSRPQLVEDGERIEFPHRGCGPIAFEGQMELAIFYRQRIIRKIEILL